VLSSPSQPSFLRALVAVLWSFAGIRKSSERSKDFQNAKPEHIIAAGLLAALVFVVGLILIVNLVISSAART
jgi:amino acid transporter